MGSGWWVWGTCAVRTNDLGPTLKGLGPDPAKIAARLARVQAGNFGDCKPVGEGVWELRVDWGPGYRVYYAMAGRSVVLLLYGGDKRTQRADIATALENWKDYKGRMGMK